MLEQLAFLLVTSDPDSHAHKNKCIKKVRKAVYYDKVQHAHFGGKSLFQATKQHLNSEE